MSAINIPVEIAQPSTGMAQAVMHELHDHLQDLLDNNVTNVIDLSSLPLSEADKRELENNLGRGEISLTLDSFGNSTIHETAYSGIWWIKHYTEDGILVAELIEICRIPDIAQSHRDDIQQSLQQLNTHIQTETQQEQQYE